MASAWALAAPVNASAIAAFAIDAGTEILFIVFSLGRQYLFAGIGTFCILNRRIAAICCRSRELIAPFGGTGYIVLFEIVGDDVIVGAVRHQREEDYRH